jgi:hypothetical protein
MKKAFFFLVLMMSAIPGITYSQTCGTTNIAQGKPVDVSGQQQYYPGSQAVDGNLGTGWYVSGDTSYIQVDLQQSYSVCKIKIYWTTNGKGKNYKAQISTDGMNWTDMFTRTNNSANTDSFNVTGSGRYVRIYTTARVNTWSSLEMLELRIYNSLSGNIKPSVSLSAPANNATSFSGSNITLTASANDPDGSITKVEFYQGTEKLGEAFYPPYSLVWPNVQAGTYSLTAKAYDNSNADSTSTPVNITVNNTNRWSLTGNTGTTPGLNFLGTTDSTRLVFKTDGTEKMTILPDGFVGIGTTSAPDPIAKLGVNGAIFATKLKITQNGWADYVFSKDYKLPSLKEVEAYIKKHSHLPGVPSASEVISKPVDVGDMQEILLKKIEELTLYIIDQQKQIEELKRQLEQKQRK